MQAVTTIGLDIAKSVFQVHGIDAEGKVVIRRSSTAATCGAEPISCRHAVGQRPSELVAGGAQLRPFSQAVPISKRSGRRCSPSGTTNICGGRSPS